jgi:molecular chaperone DnaK
MVGHKLGEFAPTRTFKGHAADDKKKLELIQARNEADANIHSVKKSLTEHGDKLEAAEKEKIEAAIKDLEAVIKGDDKDTISAKSTALMEASQKLGEKVYAEQQAKQAAEAGGGNAGGIGERSGEPVAVARAEASIDGGICEGQCAGGEWASECESGRTECVSAAASGVVGRTVEA